MLELTEPLPVPEPGQLNQAWLLQLGNGIICGLSTGTVPGVGGRVAPYACGDQWYIMEDLRTDATVWFAQKVVFDLDEAGYSIRSSVVTPVAAVWQ